MRDRRTQLRHLKRFRHTRVVGGKLLFAPVGQMTVRRPPLLGMGDRTRSPCRAAILRARVVLLAAGLILCAASACGKTVPGQVDNGIPGADSTASPTDTAQRPSTTPPPSTSASAQAAGPAVPAAAWVDADALPLNDSEHWPDLADVAQPLTDGAFEMQTLCHVVPDTTLTEGTRSARARIDRAADAWSLQQQIVHYAGDPWRRDQLAWALFNVLIDTVMNCESRVPGADVRVTTAQSDCEHFSPCSQFAATIDVPGSQVVAHVYLSSVSGSVTELSLRSSGRPRRPWSAPSDAEIIAAMTRQLCKAWRCG